MRFVVEDVSCEVRNFSACNKLFRMLRSAMAAMAIIDTAQWLSSAVGGRLGASAERSSSATVASYKYDHIRHNTQTCLTVSRESRLLNSVPTTPKALAMVGSRLTLSPEVRDDATGMSACNVGTEESAGVRCSVAIDLYGKNASV